MSFVTKRRKEFYPSKKIIGFWGREVPNNDGLRAILFTIIRNHLFPLTSPNKKIHLNNVKVESVPALFFVYSDGKEVTALETSQVFQMFQLLQLEHKLIEVTLQKYNSNELKKLHDRIGLVIKKLALNFKIKGITQPFIA